MPGVFEALGEPARRRILELLSEGERPAGELELGISQPAVSQHLKVLREAGLVQVRAEGTRRFYRLDPGGVRAAQEWLTGLAAPFDGFAQPLDAIATEVARGQRQRRKARPHQATGT